MGFKAKNFYHNYEGSVSYEDQCANNENSNLGHRMLIRWLGEEVGFFLHLRPSLFPS